MRGELRRQIDGALERRGRFVEVLALLLDQPQRQVGGREVRVELDGLIALLERRLEVAAVDGTITATSRAMIDDTGSSDCASSICSSASSSRPIGTRHDIAYQWCAVG